MSADTRPVLLGMSNPLSSDPLHALFPHPPGCTGHRIYSMIAERMPGVTRGMYLRAFDRRNLVAGKTWSARVAKEAAARVYQDLRGREVVVFGAEPRRALGLPELLVHPQEIQGVKWRQLPHPSGRNRWYNDDENRRLATDLLVELFRSAMGGLRCT